MEVDGRHGGDRRVIKWSWKRNTLKMDEGYRGDGIRILLRWMEGYSGDGRGML